MRQKNDRKESCQQGSFPKVASSYPLQLYSRHLIIISQPTEPALALPGSQGGVYVPPNPYTQEPLAQDACSPTYFLVPANYLEVCYFSPGMVQPATPPSSQSSNVPLANWEGVGTGMNWG